MIGRHKGTRMTAADKQKAIASVQGNANIPPSEKANIIANIQKQ